MTHPSLVPFAEFFAHINANRSTLAPGETATLDQWAAMCRQTLGEYGVNVTPETLGAVCAGVMLLATDMLGSVDAAGKAAVVGSLNAVGWALSDIADAEILADVA